MENENYICRLKIADDYYSATMSIIFNSYELSNLYDEIMDFIRENHIEYGLKTDVIKDICESERSCEDVMIAEGIPHKNGEDSKLIHKVDFESKALPSIKDDGSVDFKEMNYVIPVSRGDVLSIKIPSTDGVDGTTITNKSIKCKPGKDTKFSYGENTILSEDGLVLSADADGVVKMINGRITVVRLIDIDTVGPESGNVYFSGDVHVKENVLDGYTVKCDGDLTVDGVVEGAVLKVKGNLVVGKGIMGHGVSDIVVDGNLIANFIENANVYVKGEIETGEIINSSVLCDSQITVKGKKGLIIGGEITSKHLIEANRIGSRLGVITSINLGIDASCIKELKQLKENVQSLKIVEERLKLVIPVFKTRINKDDNNENLSKKLKQYEDSLLSTQIDLESKRMRLEKLMSDLKNVNKGRIKTNSIYPDTLVKIGTSSYFIDSALKECIITKSDDKVIAISFDQESEE